jgi:predicted glycosyltransferase
MRFLFYSHDGYGLGHTCRNLAIARALTEIAPRASVLLATGSDDVTRLGVPDRVEILKLPGLRKLANESYASRYLGVPPEDVRHLRSRLLLSAIESFRPDVMLVDKHPFGAGGELKDALAAIRKIGGKAVLGLRDILDDPATVRAEWTPHNLPAAIPAHYDSVIVYGQEQIFDTAAAYDFPAALRARTHYSGYVTNPPGSGSPPAFPPHPNSERPLVIATVGGGEDGFQLLKNFLPACVNAPWRTIAVTGPMMSGPEHSDLEQLAHANAITLHTFVPGLNSWYASAAAVVCMGGYNTITQTLAAATPVICVPRVHPRREQLVRAEAFARLALLRLVTPDELSPERLHEEITAAIATPRAALQQRIHSVVEFDGAEFAAHHLLSVARTAQIKNRRHIPEAKILS